MESKIDKFKRRSGNESFEYKTCVYGFTDCYIARGKSSWINPKDLEFDFKLWGMV